VEIFNNSADVLKEVFQNSFLKGKVDNYTQFLRFPDKRRRVQISFSICSLARSVRDSYQGGSDILVLYKRCLGSERKNDKRGVTQKG